MQFHVGFSFQIYHLSMKMFTFFTLFYQFKKKNSVFMILIDWFIEFLSLRVFELLSSSLLLFPQRFGQYVLQPSSGVCRTREPTRNFEPRPLLNPLGSPVLIPGTSVKYYCFVRYVLHMTSGQYSQVIQLSGDISSGSSHQRNSTLSRT